MHTISPIDYACSRARVLMQFCIERKVQGGCCKRVCIMEGSGSHRSAKRAHPVAEGDEAPTALAARSRGGVAALGRRCAVACCAGHDIGGATLAMPCVGCGFRGLRLKTGTNCACSLLTSPDRVEDTFAAIYNVEHIAMLDGMLLHCFAALLNPLF